MCTSYIIQLSFYTSQIVCYIYFFIFQFYSMFSSFQFLDASSRLQQLETERQHLDNELRAAHEKVKRAEEAQLLLEAQIVARPLKGGERIRRTQSFIPTTKERPLLEKLESSRPLTLQKNL